MTESSPGSADSSGKLGTFAGVFTPSILTILGVIMFMRAGHVVGEAGISGAVLILVTLFQFSREASVVILGFRLPDRDEEFVQLHRGFEELLGGLPTTILVSSNGDADLLA